MRAFLIVPLLLLLSGCSLLFPARERGEGEGDVGEGEGEGDEGEGEGEGGIEGEGDVEGVCGDGDLDDDEDCDSDESDCCVGCHYVAVFVDNLVGAEVNTVPVRLNGGGCDLSSVRSARDGETQELPVEVVDDGAALWFEPSLGAHTVTGWTLSDHAPAAGNTSPMWSGYSLVAHCDAGRDLAKGGAVTPELHAADGDLVAGAACATGGVQLSDVVRLDVGAVSAGDNQLFVHALVRGPTRADDVNDLYEGIVSRRDTDRFDFHVGLDRGVPSLSSEGSLVEASEVELLDTVWHDFSFTVKDTGAAGVVTAYVDQTPIAFTNPDAAESFEGLFATDVPGAVFVGADLCCGGGDLRARTLQMPFDELFVGSVTRDDEFIRALHRGVRGFTASFAPSIREPLVDADGDPLWTAGTSDSGDATIVVGVDEAVLVRPADDSTIGTIHQGLPGFDAGQRLRVSFRVRPSAPATASEGFDVNVAADADASVGLTGPGVHVFFGGAFADEAAIVAENAEDRVAQAALVGFDDDVITVVVVVDALGWWIDTAPPLVWRHALGSSPSSAQTAGAWQGDDADVAALLEHPFLSLSARNTAVTLEDVRWTVDR